MIIFVKITIGVAPTDIISTSTVGADFFHGSVKCSVGWLVQIITQIEPAMRFDGDACFIFSWLIVAPCNRVVA